MSKSSKPVRTRNFFKLVEPYEEINSSEEMFNLLEGGSESIKDVLYRPDTLAGDPSSFRRQIRDKEFVNVSFTRTVIQAVNFYNCTFRKCLFVGCTIKECEFHDCKFIDTNTHKVELKAVYINPNSFDSCLLPTVDQNIGTHLYQRLMNNSNDENQPLFGRIAAFKFNMWMRYQLSYEARKAWNSNKVDSVGLWLASLGRGIWGLWGAGVRLRRFMLCFVTVILLLSSVNFTLRVSMGLPALEEFLDAVYFTVITLTTIGYGDITPTEPIGKIIMTLQGIVGFFLFALAASTIFRRIGQ